MGWNDHLDSSIDKKRCTCLQCGATIEYETEEQEPGFRSVDYLMCPLCRNLIKTSMSVEFYNVKEVTENA